MDIGISPPIRMGFPFLQTRFVGGETLGSGRSVPGLFKRVAQTPQSYSELNPSLPPCVHHQGARLPSHSKPQPSVSDRSGVNQPVSWR